MWGRGACDLAISLRGLQLIIGELFENARTCHPHQNPVIEILVTAQHTLLELHVRDDGRTISPDQLAQVWLPDDQGERVFTGQVRGMGLGLSMVASLLWRIGGACQISNHAPEPGVDVEICIPFAARN